MRQRWTDLTGWAARRDVLRVRHPDEDVRRRGRVLLVLAASFGALAVALTPFSLLVPHGRAYGLCFGLLSLVYLGVIALARRGRVDLAVTILLLSYAVAVAVGVVAAGAVTTAPVFVLALVTLAGTLFPPRHVLPVYVSALLLVLGLPALVDGRTLPVMWTEQVFAVAVVSVVTSVAAVTSSAAISRALASAREQRDRAEDLAAQLRRANEQLEARVAARTEQLREMATRDPLTGVHNRRYVDTELPRLVAAADENHPMTVLALDVDDFKAVNDRYGHAGGDTALVEVARVLRSACRSDDVLSRVGGEEFVLLLPGTGLGDAVGIADRVRRMVSEISWPAALDGLHLTVSVGVAAAAPGTPPDQVWRLADDRLYAAKREGKDRVVARDPGPQPRPPQPGAASSATPAQDRAHSTLVKVPMMNRSEVPGARSSG